MEYESVRMMLARNENLHAPERSGWRRFLGYAYVAVESNSSTFGGMGNTYPEESFVEVFSEVSLHVPEGATERLRIGGGYRRLKRHEAI